MNLASRGVELRTVPSRGSRLLIDDIRAALDARTRVLSLSWVEFASGFRNDLDALGQLCRERGIFFFVDAIQGLGVFPLDVSATPIDFLAADGHKWLLGPEGAGIFYLRPEHLGRLRPIGLGWHSVVHASDYTRIELALKELELLHLVERRRAQLLHAARIGREFVAVHRPQRSNHIVDRLQVLHARRLELTTKVLRIVGEVARLIAPLTDVVARQIGTRVATR
jgi:selenocysteine lyase/cysteine desulfurase